LPQARAQAKPERAISGGGSDSPIENLHRGTFDADEHGSARIKKRFYENSENVPSVPFGQETLFFKIQGNVPSVPFSRGGKGRLICYSSIGNPCRFKAPKGRLTIARHVSAGKSHKHASVPKPGVPDARFVRWGGKGRLICYSSIGNPCRFKAPKGRLSIARHVSAGKSHKHASVPKPGSPARASRAGVGRDG
jgi:hypothetical protein